MPANVSYSLAHCQTTVAIRFASILIRLHLEELFILPGVMAAERAKSNQTRLGQTLFPSPAMMVFDY
jgi:hypothetical protein